MIILINCLSSVSGGAVSYLRNLVPLLSRRFVESPDGHELTLLAHESQRELLSPAPGTQCVWIGGARRSGWRRVLWERKNLAAIMREANADILFTPSQIGPYISGIKQVLMLRNMEVFLHGGYQYSWKSKVRNVLLNRASKRSLCWADRIIAVSNFTRDHLVDSLKIETDRIHTIYHGRSSVDLSSTDNEESDREALKQIGVGNQFILTCGSLLPYRRCEDVIEAFNRCADRLPAGMQLVIAGGGTDKRYGALICRTIAFSPYRDRIIAAGHVPWSVMTSLYHQCALCVIATEIEACPNIAIEAMAAGCVIVSSNKPPLPEIFQEASVQYRARDLVHLIEQIDRCMTDKDLRLNMKTRASQRAEAFSWQRCADETYTALTDWS